MKILYLLGFYPEIGGPFFSLKSICLVLSKKGINIKILSTLPADYDKKKVEYIEDFNIEVKYYRETLPKKFFPSFSYDFVKNIKKESSDCDLIHIKGVFDFYSLITAHLDKNYILSPHGTFMVKSYRKFLMKRLKKDIYMKLIGKKILNKANIIHLISNKEREDFLSFFPEFEEKIRVIPNGIDLSDFEVEISKEEFLIKYPELKDKKIILFLGRLHQIKGLDLLIPAFYKLCSERKDVHLLIVGKEDGDGYEERIRSLVRQYKLENNVTFTGLLTGKDKISAFKIADFFILPSYSENFGVSVVEAMACKKPVIVSDMVGIASEIKENNAGIIVKTDVESIYNGMRNLINDENLKKQLADNGRKMVEKYYDINKVADKMIEMYEGALRSEK